MFIKFCRYCYFNQLMFIRLSWFKNFSVGEELLSGRALLLEETWYHIILSKGSSAALLLCLSLTKSNRTRCVCETRMPLQSFLQTNRQREGAKTIYPNLQSIAAEKGGHKNWKDDGELTILTPHFGSRACHWGGGGGGVVCYTKLSIFYIQTDRHTDKGVCYTKLSIFYIQTDRQTDIQTSWFQNTWEKHALRGYYWN